MALSQFTVPQFIDVEDKIFGPVTTRQFIILLVAGLSLFVAFKLADTVLFIILLVIIGGLALTVAFVKINGQDFHYFLLNIIQNFRQPSRRVWNKVYTKKELQEFIRAAQEVEPVAEKLATKPASARRIRDLSLLVNTGGYYRPE